jgi:hypothetical protein
LIQALRIEIGHTPGRKNHFDLTQVLGVGGKIVGAYYFWVQFGELSDALLAAFFICSSPKQLFDPTDSI